MVNFKEIYHFSRFQRGSNILQGGGSNFFQGGGGSNSLFPIETHITCYFPGGGGSRPPVPSSGSAFDGIMNTLGLISCKVILCSSWYLSFLKF